VSQLAIAWVLANPAVHVAIVGTGKAKNIEAAVPALDIELAPDELAEIDTILAGAARVPFFQLEDM
jgi:aryl-alcohol dehydrogenase-like predicted oxidoreductase